MEHINYLKVRCPTGWDKCTTCHLFTGNACKYGAFYHGVTGHPRTFPGILIEEVYQEVGDVRQSVKDGPGQETGSEDRQKRHGLCERATEMRKFRHRREPGEGVACDPESD